MSSIPNSVPALVFAQNDREAAASETESLRDGPLNSYPGAVAGHAVSLAVHPDLTRTVIQLIDTGTERAEGTAHPSTDGNFPASVPPWITKDLPNVRACRTSCQEQRSYDKQ